jgi:HK97 family phage portal protein
MNLLLYGKGNSVVRVHTEKGLIGDLEPISPYRVGFQTDGYKYKIMIDGVPQDPNDNLLHFVLNPDPVYPWWGRGITVALRDVANNIKQARATEKAFMESKWKPSVIVKVDALVDEFSGPEGRKKLLDDYVNTQEAGSPWLIPADQFSIEQIKPLSLSDLAINATVELDKKTVAAILGVPPFVLGIGDYNRDAWNNFINNTKSLHKINALLRCVEYFCIWFSFQNEITVLNSNDKVITKLLCVLKQTQMTKMEIIKNTYSDYLFH